MHSNVSFYGCTFASWQDTWHTGLDAYSYAVDTIIYGQTDSCDGSIAAWLGTEGTRNGVFIIDPKIIRSLDANSTTVTNGQCYLGRPWNPLAITVYLHAYMDESIHPDVFTPGPEQYHSSGPGGNMSKRLPQEYILTDMQVNEKISLEPVFAGKPTWIDFECGVSGVAEVFSGV
ncbi:uncharacterized protein F5147DRAFT_695550 [Suillus discolor]|uniref:Pectinesterase n=1 Tax=Suillus discolor TaxID=1912936 RepID=A0A9P7F692_9AGAM|nr:uncharacterized protein F5147DRAFT_695550 [Suillus discolor]KAG2108256.1 hypothetical protein F5147DRAFT_695550 [Suillus discolor]